jgi:hypothetical protein
MIYEYLLIQANAGRLTETVLNKVFEKGLITDAQKVELLGYIR